jgi:hypothetical protein
MVVTPPKVTDRVTDSDASNHTTPNTGNLTTFQPFISATPPSIFVGNGVVLQVTSVGDTILPGPFYLINIFVIPDITQNLIFVRRFTTDNCGSMEFDLFGVSVKNLCSRNVTTRCNSSDPLYTSYIAYHSTYGLSRFYVHLASSSRASWA